MSGLINTLYYGYNLIKINKIISNITEEQLESQLFYENLKKEIFKCGCIGIKFFQWYVSRLRAYSDKKSKSIVKNFEDIFDQCPYHNINHTKTLFKQNFNFELDDVFDMDYFEPIASGSIGQVYLTKFKNTNHKVALKIKHPTVDYDIKNCLNMITYLKYMQNNQYIRNKLNLYFDFEDFVENLTLQSDFRNEAYNVIRFRKMYDSNPMIVFPKVYYFTRDIIISEYIEGEDFNNISDMSKLKTSINMICFIYSSLLIHNFMHGDLHCKNWKVKKINNIDYKLVIYDCGICFSSQDIELSRLFLSSMEDNNYEKIYELAKWLIDGDISEDVNERIKVILEYYNTNNFDMTHVLGEIVSLLSKRVDIKLNKILLNVLIFITLVEDLLKKNNLISSKRVDTSINTHFNTVRNNKLEMITFCKSKKCYLELKEYLEKRLDEEENIHNDDLFSRTYESGINFLPIE